MASSAQSSRRERPIQFGKYTLLARIGGGGMGELYLARLRSAGGFEKLVVIKRILSHLTDKQEFVDMFVAEARTAARISHPNVCQIYELGQVDGRYYMALEYLEGLPLADVMVARKRAPQLADLRLIASLTSQAAEGLFHAHSLRDPDGESAHVVHRDVTPRNIFVTSAGVTKVLDFGIVKVRGALGQVQTGSGKGTYSYMAPEQLQGENVDCRADIFALGTITWEAVVGRRLFKRSSDLLTWRAIVDEPIPRPTKFRPDLPPELDDAIMRALARPVAERYQTVRELASAVEQAIHPLGAPLTTLAVASEMEKAFPTELSRQRERVFAAHRRPEERPEVEAKEPEPVETSRSPVVAESIDDEWGSGANDTRVAEPGYAELVSRMAIAKSQQLAVPSESLLDVSSEGLALFDTQELKARRDAAEPSGRIEEGLDEGKSEPVVLDTPGPVLLRPARAPAPAALPRPSRLPSPAAPPGYVVDERFPDGLNTIDNIAAAISVSDTGDHEAPASRRRPRRRRWVPFLALALSAASGAAIVLVLNRDAAPKKSGERTPPVAGSVVAADPAATTAAAGAPSDPAAATQTDPAATQTNPAQTNPAATQANPAATQANPAQTDPAATQTDPAQTDPAATQANPGATQTDPAATQANPAQTDPAATQANPGATPGNPAATSPSDPAATRPAVPSGPGRTGATAADRASLQEAEQTARDGARERRERVREARRERQAGKAAAERSAQKQRASDRPRNRPEASQAAATSAKEGGFLTIDADPYATLFVDGKKRGFTPIVRLALAPGQHRLRLVSSQGQPDKTMRVRIVSGQELRKSVKW